MLFWVVGRLFVVMVRVVPSTREKTSKKKRHPGRRATALVRSGKNTRSNGRSKRLCNCFKDGESVLGKVPGRDGAARRKAGGGRQFLKRTEWSIERFKDTQQRKIKTQRNLTETETNNQ